jgi:hypothetical protein
MNTTSRTGRGEFRIRTAPGELGAVPKVALLIEFDERKMVVSIACFTHLVRWFLAGKFLLVNLIGDALGDKAGCLRSPEASPE